MAHFRYGRQKRCTNMASLLNMLLITSFFILMQLNPSNSVNGQI